MTPFGSKSIPGPGMRAARPGPQSYPTRHPSIRCPASRSTLTCVERFGTVLRAINDDPEP